MQDDDDDHEDLLYMPAEWSPHDACLILFPHNPQTFRLELAQHQVLQVAHAIATQGQETVYLLAKDERQAAELRQRLLMEDDTTSNTKSNSSSTGMPKMIHVHVCPSNDTWARDTGPTICFDRKRKTHRDQRIGLDWEFNAYGGPVEGCYWPCDLDQAIAKRICDDVLKIPCQKNTKGFILEGGSIHTDGDGTLLVTKECLLNKNRNPHFSQEEIEDLLKTSLGVTTILWLPHGLDADDDTNGHVDNFCCFVKPGHVVLAWTEDDVNDQENYSRCRVAESLLTSSKDARGRTIQVHRLLLPPPLVRTYERTFLQRIIRAFDPSVGIVFFLL
jgi:agmatine deiminase